MKLAKLKRELNLTTQDILDALSERYPKVSKAALSMADNEEDYGVCLTPEAERILRKKFGKTTFWGRLR